MQLKRNLNRFAILFLSTDSDEVKYVVTLTAGSQLADQAFQRGCRTLGARLRPGKKLSQFGEMEEGQSTRKREREGKVEEK